MRAKYTRAFADTQQSHTNQNWNPKFLLSGFRVSGTGLGVGAVSLNPNEPDNPLKTVR